MAITTKVLLDGPRTLSIWMTNDGATDETTAALKVDRDGTSHSTQPSGSVATIPRKTLDVLAIEEVYWSVDTFDFVAIEWNFNAADETAILLGAGEGYIDFRENGVLVPATSRDTAQAADGDIQLLTADDQAAGNYTIKLRLRKKWT